MLKRANSSFAIQKPRAVKNKNFVPMCQKVFDRNLVSYRNESALKKRWMRKLLTSVLLGFGGGFTIVLSQYIRYRIRWSAIFTHLSFHILTHSAVRAIHQVSLNYPEMKSNLIWNHTKFVTKWFVTIKNTYKVARQANQFYFDKFELV